MATTKEQALEKALTAALQAHPEFNGAIKGLTGIVMEEIEKLRGEDLTWQDGFHCEVYNLILGATDEAVKAAVSNWDNE